MDEVTGAENHRPRNKGGRPRNPLTRLRREVQEALDARALADADAIYAKLRARVDEGDATALKILVDRIWPAPKRRLVPFELAKAGTASEAARPLEEVTALAKDGELPVEVATEVARITASIAKIWAEEAELEELRARVAELTRLAAGEGRVREVAWTHFARAKRGTMPAPELKAA